MQMDFHFSAHQRKRLLDLGLLSAQADALEAHALRAIALHSRPLRLAEARSTLERLCADAQRLRKTLTTMLSDQIPAGLDSARLMLLMAHYERDGELPSPSPMPDSLLIQLETFAETAARALAKSREIKERNHSASPEPIHFIVRLMEGAVGYRGRESLIGDLPWSVEITPKFLLEVAGICYEAAGRNNTDPERAVRMYFEQEARRRQVLIERLPQLAEKTGKQEQERSA